MGADRTIDVGGTPDALEAFAAGKGYFDVLYECTGTARALSGGIAAMRPRGVVVQLGLGGDMTVPMMQITAKELDLRGSFRFHEEFATAVRLMRSGLIDVKPVITHTIPLDDAELAFRVVNDRGQAMKTRIAFGRLLDRPRTGRLRDRAGGPPGWAHGNDGLSQGLCPSFHRPRCAS